MKRTHFSASEIARIKAALQDGPLGDFDHWHEIEEAMRNPKKKPEVIDNVLKLLRESYQAETSSA